MASNIQITSFTAVGGVRSVVLSALGEAPNGQACLAYMQPAKYEWWTATSSAGANATKIAETTVGFYTHAAGVLVNITRWFRVRPIDQSGEPGDFSDWKSATTTSTGANSIDTSELVNGAVTTAKIDNLAVTSAKIGIAAVGEAQIDNAAITTAKIRDAAIDSAKIGNLAVKNAQIDNLTIGTGKVQYNATYEMSVSGQSGEARPGQRMQAQGINVRRGSVQIIVSTFIDRPAQYSSNTGYLAINLNRNGQRITSRRIFYDDNFAMPLTFAHADYGVGENSSPFYEAWLESLTGAGDFNSIDTVIALTNFRG